MIQKGNSHEEKREGITEDESIMAKDQVVGQGSQTRSEIGEANAGV